MATIKEFYDLVPWAFELRDNYDGQYRSECDADDMTINVFLKGTDRMVGAYDIMEDVGFVILGVMK